MTRLSVGLLVVIGGVAEAAPDLEAVTNAVPPCDQARAHCFAIHLHVAGDANGLVTTPGWIAAELERANHFFEPLDTGFQLAAVETLPESTGHVVTRTDRNAIAKGRLGSAR